MQSAQRCRRRERCASTGDFENVGFVFADFLYFLASVNGANDQGGLCRLGGLGGQKQCCLMRKLPEKSFDAAFEARLGVTSKRDGKRSIHAQASVARLHACGHRHEIQPRLLCRNQSWCEKCEEKNQDGTSQTKFLKHRWLNPFEELVEILESLSLRGTQRRGICFSLESLLEKQIPRFARDDTHGHSQQTAKTKRSASAQRHRTMDTVTASLCWGSEFERNAKGLTGQWQQKFASRGSSGLS